MVCGVERTDSPLASIYLSKGAKVNVTYRALGPRLSTYFRYLTHTHTNTNSGADPALQ